LLAAPGAPFIGRWRGEVSRERRQSAGGGGNSIYPFRSHKGEGGELVRRRFMREKEASIVSSPRGAVVVREGGAWRWRPTGIMQQRRRPFPTRRRGERRAWASWAVVGPKMAELGRKE
jgi:hypothetical protein